MIEHYHTRIRWYWSYRNDGNDVWRRYCRERLRIAVRALRKELHKCVSVL